MSRDLKEIREAAMQTPEGRASCASGMAGVKALWWTRRGRPLWLEQSKPYLRTILVHTATGKVRQVPGRRKSMCEGLRRETNAFCFSKYFTLFDPQNKAVRVGRVDFFFHFTDKDLKL